jgi:hypothetical protein
MQRAAGAGEPKWGRPSPGGFRWGDIWYTIQPSPEAVTASGACGYEGYCLLIR